MKWLDQLRADAKDYWMNDVPIDEKGNINFNLPWRQPTDIGYMILVLHARVNQFFRTLYCRLFDHDLEFESSIGPDSGSEWCGCRRCGYSWSHTYY